jgi:hypothetical protein
MLETTGESRDFKKKGVKERKNRLVQAIAVVMEDSLAEKDAHGRSGHRAKSCEYHKNFVEGILKEGDAIITFNYDCLLDFSLRKFGVDKWNPRYGYGFSLGPHGSRLKGDGFWKPNPVATKEKTIHLYKLHGSLHFKVTGSIEGSEKVELKQRPYTKQLGDLKFTIIPPEWHKAYDEGIFSKIWKDAALAIQNAEHIVFVGYSLPPTDLHSTALFRTSLKKDSLQTLIVVNPDATARKRTRTVLQRGISDETLILSFDYFKEFLSLPRRSWDRS